MTAPDRSSGASPDTSHDVSPVHEHRHPPDADDLWNESYYFDFVHDDGTLGGWIRLGLYPNRQVAWWTTWIVGTERPGVCSVRYDTPVPAGDGLVAEDSDIRVNFEVVDPLKVFRVAASAPAELFADAADVYAGTSGSPVRLDLDLTWSTDGSPYHYLLTTRYEIPCLVAGTVRIDDEVLTIRGQGQRDHSWGVRDWWAFGWCWSSARLDDGTRVHVADIRMPGFPVAFGYVQSPGSSSSSSSSGGGEVGGSCETVTVLSVTEDVGAHGFPTSARIALTYGDSPPAELAIDVTPLAFGPVLFRNDDGRTTRFPRAMVRYEVEDGRTGLGWVEWNQPD